MNKKKTVNQVNQRRYLYNFTEFFLSSEETEYSNSYAQCFA